MAVLRNIPKLLSCLGPLNWLGTTPYYKETQGVTRIEGLVGACYTKSLITRQTQYDSKIVIYPFNQKGNDLANLKGVAG